MNPTVDDNTFINLWYAASSTSDLAQKLGLADASNVFKRRRRVEKRYGITLPTLSSNGPTLSLLTERADNHASYYLDHDYTAVIFSDCHFWPNAYTTPAFYILAQILEHLDPEIVILNGDAFDGSRISRHPKLGWEDTPTVQEEIEAGQEALTFLTALVPDADRFWCLGNHDMRFEAYLAMQAPHAEGVSGFRLADHFPGWRVTISLGLNEHVVVKHRYHNGMHAAYNNTLKGGMTIVTGHTHALECRPFTDYRGDRFGVQTGTLADPWGPQFHYLENNPRNWQPGFVVLFFRDGQHYPVLVQVRENKTAWFLDRLWRG